MKVFIRASGPSNITILPRLKGKSMNFLRKNRAENKHLLNFHTFLRLPFKTSYELVFYNLLKLIRCYHKKCTYITVSTWI